MDATTTSVQELITRIDALEARVAQLESGGGSGSGRRSSRGSDGVGASVGAVDASGWTTPYATAVLEAPDSWIEFHELSARPQLQRLIRAVVDAEGPVTDRLVLDRVRRAWGLKRAGGRAQEAFEQAVRQLLARGLVERRHDALVAPGGELPSVRVPVDEDEATRRGAEDVPLEELALAIEQVVGASRGGAALDEDEVTMHVAKVFGWTRRGGAIQERLDAALELAGSRGAVTRDGGRIRRAEA